MMCKHCGNTIKEEIKMNATEWERTKFVLEKHADQGFLYIVQEGVRRKVHCIKTLSSNTYELAIVDTSAIRYQLFHKDTLIQLYENMQEVNDCEYNLLTDDVPMEKDSSMDLPENTVYKYLYQKIGDGEICLKDSDERLYHAIDIHKHGVTNFIIDAYLDSNHCIYASVTIPAFDALDIILDNSGPALTFSTYYKSGVLAKGVAYVVSGKDCGHNPVDSNTVDVENNMVTLHCGDKEFHLSIDSLEGQIAEFKNDNMLDAFVILCDEK